MSPCVDDIVAEYLTDLARLPRARGARYRRARRKDQMEPVTGIASSGGGVCPYPSGPNYHHGCRRFVSSTA